MVSCECEVDGRLGRRVGVGDCRGTVRYVGQVPSAAGEWLGIEWDDPDRGKHNGIYNGVRYFHTSHPTSGSFVRVERADFGRSCVSAIKERYGSNQLTLTVEELQDLQRAMNAPHLEMVGFEKINQQQSCFSNLQVLCLHNQLVSDVGEGLSSLCPEARDVDLSANLLTSWSQVAQITTCFPHLDLLNLSDNRLEVPESPEKLQTAFSNLTHMVLAHMGYSWEDVCTCSAMWPQVQKLQVPFNNITSIALPGNVLKNITELDLEGNTISQWEEINKLGVIDRLESLNLCDIGLTNINLPKTEVLFKNLQCLLISDNKLDKWEYISELHKLPKLEELRFTHNPVLEGHSVETIYYKTVARIGSLKVLNRTHITREERRGAEMDYLKEFGKEWLNCAKNENLRVNFLTRHPRFPGLVQRHIDGGAIYKCWTRTFPTVSSGLEPHYVSREHGAADESELEVRSSSLHSNLVRVRLKGETGREVIKSLPRTMQLGRLAALAQRLFANASNAQPTLTYHSSKNPNIEVKMDNNLQTLNYYSIEDGDEILVTW